jgi:hypothetical protein
MKRTIDRRSRRRERPPLRPRDAVLLSRPPAEPLASGVTAGPPP